MKKILLITCLVITIAMLIEGCTQVNQSSDLNNQTHPNQTDKIQTHNLSVYFYYHPGCPWCRMVKPYIQLIKNESEELKIVMCNTASFGNCSKKAVVLAQKAKLRGVPTAIVVNESMNGTIEKVLVGADNVAKLGKYLRMHGYNVTAYYVVGGLNYTVKDCITCHAEKRLNPPSTYSCSACCHETKLANQTPQANL